MKKIKNLLRSDVMKTSKLVYAMLVVLIALSMVTACSPNTVEAPAAAAS
jgi:predicted small secreted protein